MDFKKIIEEKGLSQIRVSKILSIHPAVISMQVNKHRLLPKKYHSKFCQLLNISVKDLIESMKEEGGSNE